MKSKKNLEEIISKNSNLDVTKHNDSLQKILKINECILSFTSNAENNIQKLTELCGNLLNGFLALYSYLKNDEVISTASWNRPSDFPNSIPKEEAVCFEILKNPDITSIIIEDLQNSKYSNLSPLIKKYKIHSYIGNAVKLDDENIGSLSVCYNEKYFSTEVDKNIISIIAGIIAVEEKRKQYEKTLHESNEKYKLLTEASLEGICILQDGKIIDGNSQLEKLFGFNINDVRGKNILDFFLPKSKDIIIENINSQKEGAFEIIGIKTDGTQIPVELRGRQIIFNGVPAVLFTLAEISERKKYEELLKRDEDHYKQLITSAPIPITIYSEGKIIFANNETLKLMGAKSENELIGTNVIDYVHPDSKPIVIQRMKILSEIAELPTIEEKFVRLDGKVLFVMVSAKKINYLGKPAVQIAINDITDRKHIEITLAESQTKLSTLINNIPGVFYRALNDSNLTLEFINERCFDLFGYTPTEMIGNNKVKFKDLIPEENKDNIYKNLNDALYKKEPYILEYQIKTKDRKTKWVWDKGIGSYNKSNELIYFEGFIIDITQQKIAEENIKKLNFELKELNKSKDKFFSIVAHDLRNPFTGLLGLSEILLEDFDNLERDEIRRFIQRMRVQTKNVFNLLENILLWSRLQLNKVDFKPEKIDLYFYVVQTTNLFEGNAARKNILLNNSIKENTFAFADQSMVSSIIRNLVSNAIKFTYSGGNITISSKIKDNSVIIKIEDTGIGIPENELESIFKIDTIASSKGTANESGTGLGLILCKEMVEKHNGNIWVESKVGMGTSFYFSLPIKEKPL